MKSAQSSAKSAWQVRVTRKLRLRLRQGLLESGSKTLTPAHHPNATDSTTIVAEIDAWMGHRPWVAPLSG